MRSASKLPRRVSAMPSSACFFAVRRPLSESCREPTRRNAMRREEGAQILVVDSITKLDESYRGQVLVAASHGGLYPAYLAAKAGFRGVILHDAGLGLDRAGIASLD